MSIDKLVLVATIKERMKFAGELKGASLFWSAATVTVLKKAGVNAIIQAGTCQWPRLPEGYAPKSHKDLPTFGYTWDKDNALNLPTFMSGRLPNMHIWAAIPESQEVIDMTSGDFVHLCKESTGLDWLAPPPPDYFWCEIGSSDWPDRVLYDPDPLACHLVVLALLAISEGPMDNQTLPYV